MLNLILTTYQGKILGPISRLLGYILQGIYYLLSLIHIQNVGICIILFTFIINALMIPLQVRQQKFTKMSAIINPEIQEIQAKYKDKKDQASQQQMSMETQAVYRKYGVRPASGCLPLIISFPILFALYRVIYNVPAYVPQIYAIYEGIAGSVQNLGITVDTLVDFVNSNTYVVSNAQSAAAEFSHVADVDLNYYIDVLGQFSTTSWNDLAAQYPSLADEIAQVSAQASHVNNFLRLNIADVPVWNKVSVLIPVTSAGTQIISTRVSMANQPPQNNNTGTMGNSMRTMNIIMPIITGMMCFMFPIGVGIYWIAGNVFRIFQALGINLYFRNMDIDEMLERNIEKNRKKMERNGSNPDKTLRELEKRKQIQQKQQQREAQTKSGTQTKPGTQQKNSPGAKNVASFGKNDKKKPSINASEVTGGPSTRNVKADKPAGNTKYKAGSIAAYANMLSRDYSGENVENKGNADDGSKENQQGKTNESSAKNSSKADKSITGRTITLKEKDAPEGEQGKGKAAKNRDAGKESAGKEDLTAKESKAAGNRKSSAAKDSDAPEGKQGKGKAAKNRDAGKSS